MHCFSSGVFGCKTLLDVALYTLDDDDGIVHHQSDGQDQPKHGKGIDGETEQREERKCTDERDGYGKKRDQRSAPVLQEEIDHKDDQRDGDQKRLNDLFHAFCNGGGLVKRYGVIHVLREALLHLRHQFPNARSRLDRIGTGQLVNRDDDGGLAV